MIVRSPSNRDKKTQATEIISVFHFTRMRTNSQICIYYNLCGGCPALTQRSTVNLIDVCEMEVAVGCVNNRK